MLHIYLFLWLFYFNPFIFDTFLSLGPNQGPRMKRTSQPGPGGGAGAGMVVVLVVLVPRELQNLRFLSSIFEQLENLLKFKFLEILVFCNVSKQFRARTVAHKRCERAFQRLAKTLPRPAKTEVAHKKSNNSEHHVSSSPETKHIHFVLHFQDARLQKLTKETIGSATL